MKWWLVATTVPTSPPPSCLGGGVERGSWRHSHQNAFYRLGLTKPLWNTYYFLPTLCVVEYRPRLVFLISVLVNKGIKREDCVWCHQCPRLYLPGSGHVEPRCGGAAQKVKVNEGQFAAILRLNWIIRDTETGPYEFSSPPVEYN